MFEMLTTCTFLVPAQSFEDWYFIIGHFHVSSQNSLVSVVHANQIQLRIVEMR